MPSKTEAAARRLVAELYRVMDGRPQAWRMVTGLRFDGDLSTALLQATKRDWNPRRLHDRRGDAALDLPHEGGAAGCSRIASPSSNDPPAQVGSASRPSGVSTVRCHRRARKPRSRSRAERAERASRIVGALPLDGAAVAHVACSFGNGSRRLPGAEGDNTAIRSS